MLLRLVDLLLLTECRKASFKLRMGDDGIGVEFKGKGYGVGFIVAHILKTVQSGPNFTLFRFLVRYGSSLASGWYGEEKQTK